MYEPITKLQSSQGGQRKGMAPVKEIVSLQELSESTLSTIVYESCKLIERQFSTLRGKKLTYDNEGAQLEVSRLQAHLLKHVKPVLWDSLFQRVIAKSLKSSSPVGDGRIIFSIFLHEQTSLRSLKIPRLPQKFETNNLFLFTLSLVNRYCRRLVRLHASRVEFWVKSAPLLTRLVELDLSEVQQEDVVKAFSKNCINLEVLSLPRLPSNVVAEILQQESCKNLKKLSVDWNHSTVGDNEMIQLTLEQLCHLEVLSCEISDKTLVDINHALKLRSLRLFITASENIDSVSLICPDLVTLSLHVDDNLSTYEQCSAILQNLTVSSWQLTKVTLINAQIETQDLDEFFDWKSIHITEFALESCETNVTIYSLLDVVSKCRNLKKLSLVDNAGSDFRAPDDLQISFPKLSVLTIVESDFAARGVALAKKCVDVAGDLTELTLSLASTEDDDDDDDEFESYRLTQLFSNQRLKKLKKLTLLCDHCKMTEALMKHVIDSCKDLTRFEVKNLTDETKQYLVSLSREMKSKNRNITLAVHCT